MCLLLNSITTRLVITTLSPFPVLTLLEALSAASSINSHEDEVLPPGAPHPIAQSSNALPVTSVPEAHPEGHDNIVESSQGLTTFKKWLRTKIKKGNKDPALHELDRLSRKSHQPADHRSCSGPPTGVDATNEGPSRMAATRRVTVSALLW